MKLDNRRTILVGLAFMAVCAFWQVYDAIVPLILKKHLRHERYAIRVHHGA